LPQDKTKLADILALKRNFVVGEARRTRGLTFFSRVIAIAPATSDHAKYLIFFDPAQKG
jgi:hypothetical protein